MCSLFHWSLQRFDMQVRASRRAQGQKRKQPEANENHPGCISKNDKPD
jgi:hypothetical protein